MKNGRVNERNAGHWSLDGEPKTRRSRSRKASDELTPEEKGLLLQVLDRVIDCMEYNPNVSDHGHLHPEAKFTDNGQFLICMSRAQFEALGEIYQKLGK